MANGGAAERLIGISVLTMNNPFFKDITITRMLDSGAQSETYLIDAVIGYMTGTAVARPNTHRRVVWEGQALVIENGSFTGRTPETGEWAERREVFSLDSDGRLRVDITTRSSVDVSSSAILLYRRQVTSQPQGVSSVPDI